MSDTKELRSMVDAAQFESLANFVIGSLLDRLEAAEKGWVEDYKKQIVSLQNSLEASEHECTEQARLNGIGAERELALMAKLEAAEKERDELRDKIEAMEQQEPVGKIVAFGESLHEPSWRGGRLPPLMTELYALPGGHPAPSFADAYQGAMEDVAIWKKRALEAEDLNRKFVAAINGSAYMGEPAQPVPIIPEGWKPIPEKHPTFDLVDLRLADGSVLCGCVPQSDGDYWWEGPSGEVFIDPRYAPVTHWRLAAASEAKP